MGWLCTGTAGGARRAGRFILHVWNATADNRNRTASDGQRGGRTVADYQEVGRELGVDPGVADECLAPFN